MKYKHEYWYHIPLGHAEAVKQSTNSEGAPKVPKTGIITRTVAVWRKQKDKTLIVAPKQKNT